MLAVLLFLIGVALGAALVVYLASPGPWPPRRQRPELRAAKAPRDSWLR